MIPILQFDPSSLTLWYDTHLISRMRGSAQIGKALDLAIRGADEELARHIAGVGEEWVATRAATLAAACWHEKRHFVDFLLTNYGALRVRQFFSLYFNTDPIFRFAQNSSELLVPIQSYREKLFCKELEIKPASDIILEIARDVRQRKRMLADDTKYHMGRFGEIELSGETLLEAVAHHIQIGKTHRVLGARFAERIQKDVPEAKIVSLRYSWAYRVLANANLLNVRAEREGVMSIDDGPFIPICYAALACRMWGQEQTREHGISSYSPSERFASIVIGLRDRASEIRNSKTLEAWDIVNQVAKELFGRTVIEEMKADIDAEASFLGSADDVSPIPKRAYEDYHALRVRLFQQFVDNPDEFLDQALYSDKIDKTVSPFVIVAASSGEIGEPPPDYSRILGYSDPTLKRDDSRWWWAASLKDQPSRIPAGNISFRSQTEWMEIVSDIAPFAKLIMDGRNIRTMLGPELIAVEARLKSQFGINVVVDPRHAFPKVNIPSNFWYYVSGRESHRCDITFETVNKPEGLVVSAWDLRLRRGVFASLIGSKYADQTGMALSLWRDWSPWFFSEEFRETYENLKPDGSILVDLWDENYSFESRGDKD